MPPRHPDVIPQAVSHSLKFLPPPHPPQIPSDFNVFSLSSTNCSNTGGHLDTRIFFPHEFIRFFCAVYIVKTSTCLHPSTDARSGYVRVK